MDKPKPYSSPSQQSSDQARSRSTVLRWLRWAAVFSIGHGLLLWWSIANISLRAAVMEGDGSRLVELVAERFINVLNFPTLIIWRIVQLPPMACFTPPFLIANSCLWGMALALIVTIMTTRRTKNAK